MRASIAESAEPLNLLLDTGAGVSVLNKKTAERLGLKRGRSVRVQGVESSVMGHWLRPVSISAAGVALPSNLLSVDLETLSRSCTQPVDGLIGADFFRGQIVQIDFDSRVIRILAPERAPTIGEQIPLELRRCGMRIPINVNGGTSRWVRLDTGCASALQWVTSKVRQEQCGTKAAIGLAEIPIPQSETTVRMGAHQFQNVPTGLHEKPIFDGEAGLLGTALLSRFSRVTIDAKSGRLILEFKPAQR